MTREALARDCTSASLCLRVLREQWGVGGGDGGGGGGGTTQQQQQQQEALLTLCALSVAGSEALLGDALQSADAAAEVRRRYGCESCVLVADLVGTARYAGSLPALRRELCSVLLRPSPPQAAAEGRGGGGGGGGGDDAATVAVLLAGLRDSWSATRRIAAEAAPAVLRRPRGGGSGGRLAEALRGDLRGVRGWQAADGAALALLRLRGGDALPLLAWAAPPPACAAEVERCEEAAAATQALALKAAKTTAAHTAEAALVVDVLGALESGHEGVRCSCAELLGLMAANSRPLPVLRVAARVLRAAAAGQPGALVALRRLLPALPAAAVFAAARVADAALGSAESSICRQEAASTLAAAAARHAGVRGWFCGGAAAANLSSAGAGEGGGGRWALQEGTMFALEELALGGLVEEGREAAALAQAVAALRDGGRFEVARMRGQTLPHLARLAGGGSGTGTGDEEEEEEEEGDLVAAGRSSGDLLFWWVWGTRRQRWRRRWRRRRRRGREECFEWEHWTVCAHIAMRAFDGGGEEDEEGRLLPPLGDLLVFAEREPRDALPFLCRVLPDLAARSPAARDAAAVAACAERLLRREREAAARCSLLEALRRCAVIGAATDGATVAFAAAPEARLPCVTASQRAAWEGGGGAAEREAVAVAVARSGCAEEAACLAALRGSLVDACCGVLACGGSEPAVCRAALRALADGGARDCAGRLLGSVEARMRDDGYELSAGGVPLPATPAEPPKVLSEWDLDSDEEDEAGGAVAAAGGEEGAGEPYIRSWHADLAGCLLGMDPPVPESPLRGWAISPTLSSPKS